MEHEELLNQFKELVNQYAQHREFINKAKSQTEKFSPAIIEKVIGDHSAKAAVVAEGVLPLVPNLEAAIAGIDIERSTIEDGKSAANEEMEELQLRQAIGELSDGDFKSLSKDLKGQLEEADARLQVLGQDRDTLNAELQRWVDLAGESDQSDGTAGSDGDASEQSAAVGMTEDVSAVFDDASDGDEEEDVVVVASVEDDVSEDFSDGGAIEAGDAEDSEEIEVAAASVEDDDDADSDSDGGDAEESDEADGDEADGDEADGDDAAEAEVEYGFDDEGQDDAVDIIAGDESGDAVELDLVGGDGGEEDAADAAGEAEEAAEGEGGDDEDARRALLLYQEGTAEEQIYPFTSEVLTIGRGRDNDIQIKNDSKVSRFHCKLFRRSSNFYIEDNKSSNGTLVNGELITERRLFGGEEVIIGETFFRFRIM